LQQIIYIFFYLFGKQNGACNLLHGEVILNGLNRKQTEFIAVPNICCACHGYLTIHHKIEGEKENLMRILSVCFVHSKAL
ncbi:hypothetical protein NQ315_014668, partial [Exocentrus adspersus]